MCIIFYYVGMQYYTRYIHVCFIFTLSTERKSHWRCLYSFSRGFFFCALADNQCLYAYGLYVHQLITTTAYVFKPTVSTYNMMNIMRMIHISIKAPSWFCSISMLRERGASRFALKYVKVIISICYNTHVMHIAQVEESKERNKTKQCQTIKDCRIIRQPRVHTVTSSIILCIQ